MITRETDCVTQGYLVALGVAAFYVFFSSDVLYWKGIFPGYRSHKKMIYILNQRLSVCRSTCF